MIGTTWSPQEFEARLRGERRSYHLEHPFERRLRTGELNPEELRLWVANRFYYQAMIPRKDAAILANCPDRAVRSAWVQRILDQDGHQGHASGIEAWLKLGRAVGLTDEVLLGETMVTPGVRFAVDAYLDFARRSPWQDAVCASLTELFAKEAHTARLKAFPLHYPWIDPEALQYFRSREAKVEGEANYGLGIVLRHFVTQEAQDRALRILRFKLDILWSMLDAIDGAARGVKPSGEALATGDRP